MALKLQSTKEENMIFQIISEITQKGNIYEAKIIKGNNENKQEYILNMWFIDIPDIISDGKIIINGHIQDFPSECNYNIKAIQDARCECCNVININQLNRPPLSLLKMNYRLNLKI